jgi:hypothetical protein
VRVDQCRPSSGWDSAGSPVLPFSCSLSRYCRCVLHSASSRAALLMRHMSPTATAILVYYRQPPSLALRLTTAYAWRAFDPSHDEILGVMRAHYCCRARREKHATSRSRRLYLVPFILKRVAGVSSCLGRYTEHRAPERCCSVASLVSLDSPMSIRTNIDEIPPSSPRLYIGAHNRGVGTIEFVHWVSKSHTNCSRT